MNRNNYSLEVLVNGRPVQEYYKENKTFVEGRENTEYTIRFRNNSHKRVMAIFSVDGVDVLKGKKASEAESGYIVDPFSNIEIKGYRINENEVAKFRFSESGRSYSNTVGALTEDKYTGEKYREKTTRNNGTIGVRVYEEKVPDYNYTDAYKSYTVNNTGWPNNGPIYTGSSPFTWGVISGPIYGCGGRGMSAGNLPVDNLVKSDDTPIQSNFIQSLSDESCQIKSFCDEVGHITSKRRSDYKIKMGDLKPVKPNFDLCSFDLGSSWGQKVEDRVTQVHFEKSDTYVDIVIYYATRYSLERYGINFSNTKQYVEWPSAFDDRKGFCKVPEGYKG